MRTSLLVCIAAVWLSGCESEVVVPAADRQPSAFDAAAATPAASEADASSPPIAPTIDEPGVVPPVVDEPTWGHFSNPSECAACHPDHAAQWEMSPHAYAAVDPVFRAMLRLGQRETEGELDQFCTRCHSPFAVRTEQTPVVQTPDGHDQPLEALGPIARAGVSCDVCHTAVSLGGDDLLQLDRGRVRWAGIEDPVPNSGHDSAASPLQQRSNLCGACHDVELDGLMLERTFSEWLSVSGVGQCQQCHMPTRRGRAAKDGPEREVHDHTFVGVDVSLLPPEQFPGYEQLRALSRQLLQEQSVRLAVDHEPAFGRLTVGITNLAGHALPSGATADRQLWVEVRVFDDAGQVRFASGTLDARGDLRDGDPSHTLEPGSDPQLMVFRQRLLSHEGEVHFPWQASSLEDNLIDARETAEVHYVLGALPPGEYEAVVRLRIRAFPPYLLRLLEEEAELSPDVAPRMPVVDMATIRESVIVR